MGVVYGIDVIDHDSWMAGTPQVMLNDYVGQTRQQGRARENQHRDTQRFSDLIVGSPRVLWQGMCTDVELDEVERRFIQQGVGGVRPRLNYLLNEDNPARIPKYTQTEQRHARDDREGRARWVPLERRKRAGPLDAPTRVWPASPSRKPRPVWQVKVALWSTAWFALAVIFSGLCTRHAHWSMLVDCSVGAGIGSLLLAWGVWRKPDTFAMWRKRLRKIRRWW